MSTKCKECGSYAINPNLYERDGTDLDLCDVHFWMKRAKVAESRLREAHTELEAVTDMRAALAEARAFILAQNKVPRTALQHITSGPHHDYDDSQITTLLARIDAALGEGERNE